jgi:hypothetical protein
MKTPNIVDARRILDPKRYAQLNYVAIGMGSSKAQPSFQIVYSAR